jgi:predicted site-specific integrase-resolvase
MEQLFIKLEETAQIMGLNKRTVTRLIKQGKLRAKDVNASKGIRPRWIVLKEDILALTNTHDTHK